MKKIETIVETCEKCRFCQDFTRYHENIDHAFICMESKRVIEIQKRGHPKEEAKRPCILPDWCPLETYKEVEKSETRSTIILPGMPDLEWMTENLSGFGGTEIDGRTYYTYDEAVEAVKQLGNGWRLPTRRELVELDKLGSIWQEEGPHGLPGRLFGGGLFLEASGFRNYASGALYGVGTDGDYWSSSTQSGSPGAGHLRFGSTGVYPLYSNPCALSFTVRCVRDVK